MWRVTRSRPRSDRHQWQAGDLLLVDNLAVAHLAAPATQAPPEEGGLRVLHRVVVAGVEPLTPAAGPAKPSAAPQPSMAARGPELLTSVGRQTRVSKL